MSYIKGNKVKVKKVQKTLKKQDPNTIPEIDFKQKYKLWREYAFNELGNKKLIIAIYTLIPLLMALIGAFFNWLILILPNSSKSKNLKVKFFLNC